MSVKLDLIPCRVTGLFKFNVVRVNHGDGGTGVVKRNVQRCFRTDISVVVAIDEISADCSADDDEYEYRDKNILECLVHFSFSFF